MGEIFVADGFRERSRDSKELSSIKNISHGFFQGAMYLCDEKYRSWIESTYNHTSRVVLNEMYLFLELRRMFTELEKGNEVDEEIFEPLVAAGLLHDIGRLMGMPSDWDKSPDDWYKHKDQNHHIISSESCTPYLEDAGYREPQISKIKSIILAHDDDELTCSSPVENRIMQVGDKMDKMGTYGVNRLFSNRKFMYPDWTDKQRLDDVRKVTEKAKNRCIELDIVPHHIEEKYSEGIERVDELLKSIA